MRTSLNTFHRNNIHRALLLSCALTVLSGHHLYADDEINLFVDTGVSATLTGILSDNSPEIGTTYRKTGGGTLVLTPDGEDAIEYAHLGNTSVAEGTLELGNNNAIYPNSNFYLYPGTTLRAGGNITPPFQVNALTNALTGGGVTLDAQSYTFTFNYPLVVQGSSPLTLKGAGPIIFGATNALQIPLHVGDGVSYTTLILSSPNAIGIYTAPILAKTGTTLCFGAGTYSMTIASF